MLKKSKPSEKAQARARSFRFQNSHYPSLYTEPSAQCLAIWGSAQVLVKLNKGVFRKMQYRALQGSPLLWVGGGI